MEKQMIFNPFRFDPDNACVWRGAQAIALTPKAFAVLECLVANAGQLMTKEALLGTVWPHTAVSDAVLKVCMGEIRKALGDSAKAPQFIATVHRRGYRFIAHITEADRPDTESEVEPEWRTASDASVRPPQAASYGPVRLVGREAPLIQLHGWLEQARRGERQLVFVTGEPGIGKTAMVEAFVAQANADPHLWVARGQCAAHYGAGEAYMPVLEALGRLCRAPGCERLIALLRQQAPTWLVQMPWLLSAADREALQRELLGATRERMLREMAEAVELLTAQTPLLLVLEDLHWSDYATLDLVAFLAQRREPARLLLIGTYRPVEVIVSGHPLKAVKQELQQHGRCEELPLELLAEADVAEYLAAGYPGSELSADLARLVHHRTEGHPLFMVNLVEYLVAQGLLSKHEGRWTLEAALDEVEVRVPESIRQMIEQQIESLAIEEQRVLEAASVAGMAEWPDGTVAGGYEFIHALYQNVVYQQVGAARRMQLHRRIGERVEVGYGDRVSEIAAELAGHFERGRDASRAVHYLWQAAQNATRRYAHREATGHLAKGLDWLKTLPETPEHTQQELTLQLSLGAQLAVTRGYGAAAVECAFARARELCQQMGTTAQLFPALFGLWRCYLNRAEYQTARELAEQCLALAPRVQDDTLLLAAHHALAWTLFALGELVSAREHLEQGIALYDPQRHRSLAITYGTDPGVHSLSLVRFPLSLLGYPAQALQRSQEALMRAQELSHPISLAIALDYAAILHQFRREGQAVREQAEAAMALFSKQGFTFYLAVGTILRGWALAEQGQGEEGIVQIRQGLTSLQAMGAGAMRPYFLALLAEACGKVGRVEEGLAVLAEALAVGDRSGERFYEAERYRLKGELLLLQVVGAHGRAPLTEAEACFRQALDIARRQHAKLWELRAAMSLSRLWQRQGKLAEAQQLLAESYNWFTEEFDAADLGAAKALWDELSGPLPTARGTTRGSAAEPASRRTQRSSLNRR